MPVRRLVESREDAKPDARIANLHGRLRLPGVISPRQWLFGADTKT